MATETPRTSSGVSLPVLGARRGGGAHHVTAGASSARNATAFSGATRVLRIWSEVDFYYELGGAAVTVDATGHKLPAGIVVHEDITDNGTGGQATNIAVLAASLAGVVHISELE